MFCGNEIKEEEVYNIYRIEYMPSSNWTLGAPRMIWVLELGEEDAKRSLYVGAPLNPEFRRYKQDSETYLEEMIEEIKSGKRVFANRYDLDYYCEFLNGCEVWNWSKKRSDMLMIDGPIFDVTIFTKDSEGNDKICRYYFERNPMDFWIMNQFDSFFETMYPDTVEPVCFNTEMMERSDKLQPGNYDDESSKSIQWISNEE